MTTNNARQTFPEPAAVVRNRDARTPILLLCDHATNTMPEAVRTLGLGAESLETHIALDLGAASVTATMAEALDAASIQCGYSRLLIDVNRAPSAPDSIVATNDGIRVPGNEGLTDEARAARVAQIYEPYHQAVEAVLDARLRTAGTQLVVSIHSFTPRMHDVQRPWDIGVIFNRDQRLARALVGQLVGAGRNARLTVGLNEPYSPEDRVYHTLERHAEARGLPCVMVEVANDQLATAADRQRWADCLSEALTSVVPAFAGDDGPSQSTSP